MNARELIEQLGPLTGNRIRITDVDGNEHEQMCVGVEYLPPGQRDGNQGNVILWNEDLTPSGAPAGFTMMARNATHVFQFGYCMHIALRSGHEVYIEVLE